MRISAIPTVTPLNLFSYHCGSKTCLVSSISFNQTTRVRVSNALNEETGMPDENADTDLRTRETLQIETVEERKGLRKRTKPRRKHKAASVSLSSETETKKESSKEKSLLQKAVEIYLGEKGILFWLNKISYSSIFVVIGAWILFRFVGPSLGLYNLQSPLLEPTKAFSNDF
eukprot:TRINITY_DN367_c0_g1_i1.p1 TRINITY_DN367_c0_g1~~TRINITY_DN367_c0_g1_i1.p1  ORF type:complete len:172 (+),score=22.72 TRINITY_DN367_c0_g1_i1:184-699(+)